jgi:hypothetical protein
MQTLPDDNHWQDNTDEEDDVDMCCEYDIGETSIDRYTKAIGLKSTWNILVPYISNLLQTNEWKSQYIGLRLLGNYLELTVHLDRKELIKHHTHVSSILIYFIQHEHIRIRAAAYYACGQLFLMHGTKLKDDVAKPLVLLVLESYSHVHNNSTRIKLYVSNIYCIYYLI